MTAELVLPPDVTSVGVSRRFVRSTLAEWHLDGLADTAVLLTSEVVTNSVLHARTEIVLSIAREADDSVTISVHDGSQHQPRARSHSLDATTGRGMELLDRLSLAWHIDPDADGKTLVFTVGGADPWAAFSSINWDGLEADR